MDFKDLSARMESSVGGGSKHTPAVRVSTETLKWLRGASRSSSGSQRMRDPPEELSVRLGSNPDGSAG